MIKRKGWRIALVAFILLVFLGYLQLVGKHKFETVNVSSSKSHPLQNEIHLTHDQVALVFNKHSEKLTPQSLTSTKFDLNGVHPNVYLINQNKNDKVYIYEFKSLKARKQATENIEYAYALPFQTIKPPSPKVITRYNSYYSWNLYFVQAVSYPLGGKPPKDTTDIDSVIFKYLNDGIVTHYAGKTPHWHVTMALKSYSHWYKDDNGHVLNDSEATGVLSATNKDVKLPMKNVSLGYEWAGSGGESMSMDSENDHVMTMNVTPNPPIDLSTSPQVTIEWNFQSELATLRKQETKKK